MKKESPADATTIAPELTPEQLAELQTLAAKADENWDRLLRVTADFENFKNSAARERTEAAQFAQCHPAPKTPADSTRRILKWPSWPRKACPGRKSGILAGRHCHDPAAA